MKSNTSSAQGEEVGLSTSQLLETSSGPAGALTADSITTQQYREGTSSPSETKEALGTAKEGAREGLEGVDPAIADALKAPKNRATVLRFEEDVLTFLQSTDEALLFPLSLSGYQRLLAHRTAQYHGLQTATVDDGGDDHGKIKATKPQSGYEPKPKLADMRVPEPEEQREQPKSLKKKAGERQSRREREAGGAEAARGSSGSGPQRSFQEREQDYQRARERLMGAGTAPQATPFGPRSSMPPVPLRQMPGFPGPSIDTGRAVFRNREEEMRDPEFQRDTSRSVPSSSLSSSEGDPRRRPSFPRSFIEEQVRAQFPGIVPQQRVAQAPMPMPGSLDASAAHMMGGLSLHHPAEQAGYMHPGMGMPGYGPMQMPFAYVPSAAGMPQAFQQPLPHMQGMGMYGSPPMPYASYQMPHPYAYMPGRPGQHPMMPHMMGQPMPGAMPFYPGYIPQGYNMPMIPNLAVQQQMATSYPGRQGSAPPGSPPTSFSSTGLGYRRVSAPAFMRPTRVNSSSSITSTAQGGGAAAASTESVSGEAQSSPNSPRQ